MPDIEKLIVKLDENIAAAEAEKVKMEDGDVLVVTTDKLLPPESRGRLAEQLNAMVRDLGVRAAVLILDDGMRAGLLKTSQLQLNAVDDRLRQHIQSVMEDHVGRAELLAPGVSMAGAMPLHGEGGSKV